MHFCQKKLGSIFKGGVAWLQPNQKQSDPEHHRATLYDDLSE
jgi:hypothetical protein